MEISFKDYVEDVYSKELALEINTTHEEKLNKKVFKLSIDLLIWSMFGLAADLLMGLVAGYLTISYGLHFWTVTGPTVIFLILNIIAKFCYVRNKMNGDMSLGLMFLGVIPYFGSGVITANTLRNNPIYRKSIVGYFKKIKTETTPGEKMEIMFFIIKKHQLRFILAFTIIALILIFLILI